MHRQCLVYCRFVLCLVKVKMKHRLSLYVFIKQEAQLPQRNSASAAHMEGAKPSSPPPPPLATPTVYAYGRIRNPQQTYVKRAVRNP